MPINLEAPKWVANNYVGTGYIGTTPNAVLGIYAGPTLDLMLQNYANGSNWNTFVPIPPDFTGTGQWQYAQIVTPGEYETPVGGTQKQSTETGLTGLDDQFPYETLHDTGGNFVIDVDSPNFPVLDTYSAVTLDDAVATYLMFKPPLAPSAPNTNDVQWVPLAESSWSTGFNALRPGTGHWASFPLTQSVGPISLVHDFQPLYSHPHWDIRIDNNVVFP